MYCEGDTFWRFPWNFRSLMWRLDDLSGFHWHHKQCRYLRGKFQAEAKDEAREKKSCEIIAAFTGSMHLKLKSQCFCVQELEFSHVFSTIPNEIETRTTGVWVVLQFSVSKFWCFELLFAYVLGSKQSYDDNLRWLLTRTKLRRLTTRICQRPIDCSCTKTLPIC